MKVAFLSLPLSGHLNPMAALARKLQSRGHEVVFIRHLPPQFHYAGPFHDNEGREPVPFPWEKLTRKPLIYASMGTLVNGQKNLYRTILEGVGQFPDMQVVLSVGKNVDREIWDQSHRTQSWFAGLRKSNS